MNKLLKPRITPLLKIYDVSKNNVVYIKDETKQYTNAFKYRGVYNKFKVTNFDNYNGVVTASTGNHAQAVAFCAKQLGIKCTVFIPHNTPIKKTKKILGYSAKIYDNKELETYQICVNKAKEYALDNNYIYISSFDDIDIINGHKSIMDEIEIDKIDYTFSPIGGGGLISALLLSNRSKVIGVEMQNNDAMRQSLKNNQNTEIKLNLKDSNSFCEGILVSKIGDIPFNIAKKNNLEIINVDEKDIKNSINRLRLLGIKAEGAGAASYAAYLKSNICNSIVLCIVSGGNIDDYVYNTIIKEV